ncbi:HD-GYP domain-containing protein [Candidatus Omnitrophota bacterium]
MPRRKVKNGHMNDLRDRFESSADESCELLRHLRMNYDDVIKVLIRIVEEKDEYTRGHSVKVTRLSVKLAVKLKLSKNKIEEIKEASLLHDIGKIAIDKRILNKPGPLTEEEYQKIVKHPEIGARIVGQSHAFKHLVPGVRHHHEKFSGGGYPNPKMKKKRIPLYARIICIADAWDAMRSNRSYRKALSREEAMDEVKRCAGTQFDPKIATAFLNII